MGIVLVFLRKNTRIHTKKGEIHMNFSFWPFLLGRHREGRREGVELLKDLHGFLRPPPLLKKPPPPF